MVDKWSYYHLLPLIIHVVEAYSIPIEKNKPHFLFIFIKKFKSQPLLCIPLIFSYYLLQPLFFILFLSYSYVTISFLCSGYKSIHEFTIHVPTISLLLFQYKRKKKLMGVKFVRNIFSRHVRNIGIRIGDGKIHFFLIRLVTFNYLVKRKIHSNCYVLKTITYYIYFYFLV